MELRDDTDVGPRVEGLDRSTHPRTAGPDDDDVVGREARVHG
jgi:hypothetical protein